MQDQKNRNRLPAWFDAFILIDFATSPLLSAVCCLLIAPPYLFSKRVREKVDENGMNDDFSFLTFVFVGIGALLWGGALIIGGLMLLSTLFGS